MKTWPGNAACLRFAAEALATRPDPTWVQRVAPVGSLVWRAVLPLYLCPSGNRYAELSTRKRGQLKSEALQRLMLQHGGQRVSAPLPGRPHVQLIRFSSQAPDTRCNWDKVPVDRLQVKHRGMGLIRDDDPISIDLHAWWEKAPPGKGFCLVRVYTGATT